MKKLLILSFFAISFFKMNAQEIEATTTAGKKVILNLDNKTWDYANSEDGQKSCYTYHTANVNFVNKTTKDVYLYYCKANSKGNVKYIKIQAGESEPIESLTTKYSYYGSEMKQIKYGWVASYELYSDLNKNYLKDELIEIKGFNSNEFTIEDCETKEIKIKD